MWKRLRNARLIWPSLSAMAGVAMLAGLGIWQLERLQWKEALIARIGERASAPPVLLEAALERWRSTRDVEYLHVRATGQFQHDKERFLYSPGTSALGWHVYTPFQTSAGPILWINRGWVDDPHKLPQRRAAGQIAGETEVRGLLRVAGEPGLFTPANDAERNLWYWPDLAGMTASAYGPCCGTCPGGTAPERRSYQGRSRLSGIGFDHQRPLHRQRDPSSE